MIKNMARGLAALSITLTPLAVPQAATAASTPMVTELTWMPPAPEATCRYVAEWVGTKLRWGLTADRGEVDALALYADGPCETTVVHYTPAT